MVRDVDIDLVDRDVAAVEDGLRRRNQDTRRELEDLAAVHVHVAVAGGIVHPARAAAGEREMDPAATVGAELEAEKAALGRPLEDDSAGAVTEEDERRAVGPVQDLG